MTATTQTWRFKALDTWFFRESRPMESIGGSELLSAFPPSPRTLSGAVRSVVGEHKQADWQQWRGGKQREEDSKTTDIKKLIGDADSLGQLSFSGPWLARETTAGQIERLYPVPLNLVIAKLSDHGDKTPQVKRMQVGIPHACDLGKQVRMAVMPKEYSRERSVDNFWLPAEVLQNILVGDACEQQQLIETRELFEREARLGIARINATRSVETGMLYQTRHVRPHLGVVIETDVTGLAADDHPAEGIVRLGGEGRGAAFSVHSASTASLLKPVQARQDTHGIMLMLLTPACMGTASEYIPLPGFTRDDNGETTVWKGVLHKVSLTLHCAIQGKPVREGGWDLANHKPRPVQSLIPAGSVYYLTVDNGDIQAAIDALHLKQLPANKLELALGRGLLAVGLWPASELINKE